MRIYTAYVSAVAQLPRNFSLKENDSSLTKAYIHTYIVTNIFDKLPKACRGMSYDRLCFPISTLTALHVSLPQNSS